MPKKTFQGRIKPADLRETLDQLGLLDVAEELADLMDRFQLPAETLSSFHAARRTFQHAEQHLLAACALAETLRGHSDD